MGRGHGAIDDFRLLERSGNPDSSGTIDYCISRGERREDGGQGINSRQHAVDSRQKKVK